MCLVRILKIVFYTWRERERERECLSRSTIFRRFIKENGMSQLSHNRPAFFYSNGQVVVLASVERWLVSIWCAVTFSFLVLFSANRIKANHPSVTFNMGRFEQVAKALYGPDAIHIQIECLYENTVVRKISRYKCIIHIQIVQYRAPCSQNVQENCESANQGTQIKERQAKERSESRQKLLAGLN